MSALTDPIADYLTRLRNASTAGKVELTIPYSKMKEQLSRILKQEGYIESYEVTGEGVTKAINVVNKFMNRTPAITGLKRISKPGFRRYVGATEIPRVLGGMGISILSTSQGIITGREAKRKKAGGELIAYVW